MPNRSHARSYCAKCFIKCANQKREHARGETSLSERVCWVVLGKEKKQQLMPGSRFPFPYVINRKGTVIPVKGKIFTEANKAARQPILFPNSQKMKTLTLLPVPCLTGVNYSQTTSSSAVSLYQQPGRETDPGTSWN